MQNPGNKIHKTEDAKYLYNTCTCIVIPSRTRMFVCFRSGQFMIQLPVYKSSLKVVKYVH